MLRLTLVTGIVALLAGPSLSARAGVRYQFELYQNGSLVAKPIISVEDGKTGCIDWPNVANISFTPKEAAQDRTKIDFVFTVNGKQTEPSIILEGVKQGSIVWKSAAEAFELRVARSQ